MELLNRRIVEDKEPERIAAESNFENFFDYFKNLFALFECNKYRPEMVVNVDET